MVKSIDTIVKPTWLNRKFNSLKSVTKHTLVTASMLGTILSGCAFSPNVGPGNNYDSSLDTEISENYDTDNYDTKLDIQTELGYDTKEDTIDVQPEIGYDTGKDLDNITEIDTPCNQVPHWADKDNDGYGAGASVMGCEDGLLIIDKVNYVLNSDDCDDTNKYIKPGAIEICDNKDNNCDGNIDLVNGVSLEQVGVCDVYNTNNNGSRVSTCQEGKWIEGACIDSDECEKDTLEDCLYDNTLPGFKCSLVGEVYQLVPVGSENSGTYPDGLDNNCNGTVDEDYMVNVPAGQFNMGCNSSIQTCGSNGESYHKVILDEFDIDKFEVTNRQYTECVKAGICTEPSDKKSYTRPSYFDNAEFADFPVVFVNWDQAKAYCLFAGKDLPTEAQWEKAAKGTGDNTYPWGDAVPTCDLVNYNMCVGDTSKVGSYPEGASDYGVMDMSGNALEWVNDWFDSKYYNDSPINNPPGPEVGELNKKVVRGGSWATKSYELIELKTYGRFSMSIGFNDISSGFRCVKIKK